ncbi:MAG: enoyl-CoA hydratase/isomerase family protein [Pseudomonadota bacterium]
MNDDILFERIGDWGVITVNRPKALNALTLDMVKAMRTKLAEWAPASSSVKAVLVKAAGERAFCAGGDIRWLHDTAKEDPKRASEFFREEYRNNVQIHHYPKPYLSLMDGIVMGGGVGISVHGAYRVVGPSTMFAMPETGIGLFPDVGGGHFLPRLPDGLGLYYALTGARANAADCVAAGIGTHYIDAGARTDLESALLDTPLRQDAKSAIESILDDFCSDPGPAPINDIRDHIARLFRDYETLETLMEGLETDTSSFAQETLAILRKMSPTSMKITFEQMLRGQSLGFDEVMRMEFRVVRRILDGRDFYEGVRAQIIDKDRSPSWVPNTIANVDDNDIERYFQTLGEEELVLEEAEQK